MPVGIDAEEVLHLALVPMRRGERPRYGWERRPGRIDLRLDRDELAAGKSEQVVKTVATPTLALVGTRHHDEPCLALARERAARFRKRVRRNGDADRVRDIVAFDDAFGESPAKHLDHGTTPSTPATAVNPLRSAGGSHTPITSRAARGKPMNEAANGNAALCGRPGLVPTATRRTWNSIPPKTSTVPASRTTAPTSALGRPRKPACAMPNSLVKGANGGVPVIARVPSTRPSAGSGATSIAPCNRARRSVP